jgi:hypothetical protein
MDWQLFPPTTENCLALKIPPIPGLFQSWGGIEQVKKLFPNV